MDSREKDISKPLDAASFVSILDSENIELFNRNHLSSSDTNQGWLWFMEQKRLQYYHMRRRWSNVLTMMFAVFFLFAMLFLLMAIRTNGTQPLDDDLGDASDLFILGNPLSRPALRHAEQCILVSPEERIDCNPDPPISREICLSRGCCWLSKEKEITAQNISSTKALPPLNVPYCFFGSDYHGYRLEKEIDSHNSPQGKKVVNLKRIHPSGFDRDVENVKVEIDELSSSVLRIKMTDSKATRYEVPMPVLNLPKWNDLSESKLYRVEIYHSNSSLVVYRATTTTPIFQVNLTRLIYSDQFIQITNKLPSDFIYGIGENYEAFRKSTEWKRYTLFARDQYPVPSQALYGSHPFYLTTEEADNSSHGVFLFNSNAMDIITQPEPSITYRTIGGVLDFFLFLGPSSENVIEQYHNLIGLPELPPYWSLGFHLCRFGYQNLSNLEKVYRRTKEAKIPYDVQWTDIDLYDSRNDFTYDHTRFAGMPEFISKLHSEGMRFVPIIDPGISASEQPPDSYRPFKEGVEMNVFLKNSSGQLFVGKVWNLKTTVWPDFTHPNATRYWTRQFATYHKEIEFDGAWIDMNEPSNFADGALDGGCPFNCSLENPQYTPGMTDDSLTLRHHTVCMSVRQTAGLHYNVHNLFGLSEAIVTNRALKSVLKRRPFILSRSTAPGHGHFAAHWDGDVVSDWPSMKWTISSILNFNMFGVPLVGADICGFNQNTTVELCARWHQLGAFYSFSRNHNSDDCIEQDPVALGPVVVEAARKALEFRYGHLPYLYTLFYKVHRHGGTVLRPLFFEFPADLTAGHIDTQFMWGPALMVAPALQQGEQQTKVYFPPGTWFHAFNHSRIDSNGNFVSQEASFENPNVYYRAGHILAGQQAELTTDQTRNGNFTLYVILQDENATAVGHLYWDSGDGLDTEELGHYNLYEFKVNNKILQIKSNYLGYSTEQKLDDLVIIGFHSMPSDIFVNGMATNWHWSQQTHIVLVDNLNLSLFNAQKSIQHLVEWKIDATRATNECNRMLNRVAPQSSDQETFESSQLESNL